MGGGGEATAVLESRVYFNNQAWLFVIMTFGLFVFSWGISQLQSNWSLAFDHGLDNVS